MIYVINVALVNQSSRNEGMFYVELENYRTNI